MGLPSKNINLNLYRVFYTVAKTKSFSESSRVLHISQPAISKHIQNLEYELNTLLFFRTNRGIELTPEAITLLSYVEKAYNYLMIGERELQEEKELTKGKLTIGIYPYLSIYYIKEKIMTYMKHYPNITMNMSHNTIQVLLEQLNKHILDFLIIPGDFKSNKEYKVIELFEIDYCFACTDEHLSKSIKTLEDVLAEPLILATKQTKSRETFNKYLASKNLTVTPKMELDTTEMLLTYIKEGLGITFIPRKIAEKENLFIIELEEQLPQDKVCLIYNEDSQTNSSKEFIKLLKEDNI